jgi:hypothetical protein
MTGAEHYALAENEMSFALQCVPGDDRQTAALAMAQVHATLALAAAPEIAISDAEVPPVAVCNNHGTAGLCMNCLIPIVEAYGERLMAQVRR